MVYKVISLMTFFNTTSTKIAQFSYITGTYLGSVKGFSIGSGIK